MPRGAVNESRHTQASGRTPSLLMRLSITALLVIMGALGLIGLAVNQAYWSAQQAALAERLQAVALTVLAGLEVDERGELSWTGSLADSALAQPGSGVYAIATGPVNRWLSPSTLGIALDTVAEPLPRGEQRLLAPTEQAPWYRYLLSVGWELADGQIVDLQIQALEAPERIEASMIAFRRDLWRWLGLAGVVLLLAEFLLLAQPLSVLRRVTGELEAIEHGRKEAIDGDYPRELLPLIENINALLATERANARLYAQALADLAHSLKTPLAVLASEADRGDPVAPAELRELVSQMEVRIRAELDRAAQTTRRTMVAPVDAAALATRVINGLRRLYPDHHFVLNAPPSLPVAIEARDLIEVYGNLLDNAAKYGAGRVELSLARLSRSGRRSGLAVTVEDDGPGIDPGDFDRMLERGMRGDERREGQGLGLAIVRRIAESYHGTVEADRASAGGLKVTVRLFPG
ncbi:MAG: ATP-binding protein [Wenzhouxiangellaceae bacterium]